MELIFGKLLAAKSEAITFWQCQDLESNPSRSGKERYKMNMCTLAYTTTIKAVVGGVVDVNQGSLDGRTSGICEPTHPDRQV